MEIVHRDEREGLVEVRVTNLDDLWVLKSVVEPGDRVRARTFRRESSDTDMVRARRGERRPVTLTVRVESVEFHRHSERLRLLGIVLSGDEEASGRHHTINVEVGESFSIYKDRWRSDQLERLEDSVVEGPSVGILTIEEGEAFYGLVREFGVDRTFTVKGGTGKRYGESSREEFFGEVAVALSRAAETQDLDAVIVAGPGFTRDDLVSFISERHPELSESVYTETCSGAGPGGVQEVIRRGAVDRVGRESRLSRESRAVERLLKEIATRGRAAYGPDEVDRSLEMGAVEELLITDERLRSGEEWSDLVERAEQTGGEYLVVSSEHEPGVKLDALGGVAALLRFRIE
ncbi:MAG: Protein pelota [Methanonatronarchaeales archaeon]|nr:Protein pelota [Methanonatronarchaeales archaeon]